MERIQERLRVVFFPNPEKSDNFFAVEDIADEYDAYRVYSVFERFARWMVELGEMSSDYIVAVEFFDGSPLDSPDVNPDTPPVGWVRYFNPMLDGDGTWNDWVKTHIKPKQ